MPYKSKEERNRKRAENRDAINAYNREWRARNADRVRDRQRQKYAADVADGVRRKRDNSKTHAKNRKAYNDTKPGSGALTPGASGRAHTIRAC